MSDTARVNGRKYNVSQSASGTWHAQGGWGYGSGATRGEAVSAAEKMARSAIETEGKADAERAAKATALRSRQSECRVCGIRTTNLRAHNKTKKHKNAVAWAEHKRYDSMRI